MKQVLETNINHSRDCFLEPSGTGVYEHDFGAGNFYNRQSVVIENE